MSRQLVDRLIYEDTWMRELIAKYGSANVENTMIFVMMACNPKGLRVSIPATKERVKAILSAIHDEYLGS